MVALRNIGEVLTREGSLFRDGKTMESVLADLYMEGFSVIECIRVVMTLQSRSLPEAKVIVHQSEAWADLRETHEAAQLELEQWAREELD